MSRLNRVPIQHHFAVLLDDDRRHLTNDQQLQDVDGHGENEKELDLLSSLFVLKVESLFVRGEDHSSQHLENCALQIAESFQLVTPRVRDHVRKHHCEGPPKASKEEDKGADVSDDIESALDVDHELEEWNEEGDEEDQVDSLHVVQRLVSVH